jgi:GT2 family glycosyltransferase
VLDPDALLEVARLLRGEPGADIIYTDEDRLAPDGRRVAPRFKPDWAYEMFLSLPYTGRLAFYRRSLVEEAGGLGPATPDDGRPRGGPGGGETHGVPALESDLPLRLVERGARVLHIPRVLYHRGPGAAEAPPAAHLAAVQAHLARTGAQATAEPGMAPGTCRVRWRILGEPLVSLVIPTRDRLDLLERCVRSIEERTGYPHREIVIVDNQSREGATLAWLEAGERQGRFRVVPYPGAFNFAAINNAGVAQAKGEHVVLLNNDTEVIAGEWLEAMLEHSQRPEVGAVGARLLYPDGTIQHAGVVLGLGGVAGHSHKHRPADEPGSLASVAIVRNYSAVTAACLMMRRGLFVELGGMNERDLAVAFNDVDLCLRIRAAGYRVVYTPYATLYHHESASRGFDLDGAEVAWMRRTWGPTLARDPYYNPNLTTVREDFSLAL